MSDLVCFDAANQSLHTSQGTIQLPPKAFGILLYLRERPQQLVTKEELLKAIWPGLYVTDAVLKVTIGELRKALDDDAKAPRYIETVHRRGYRFIGLLPAIEESQTKASTLVEQPIRAPLFTLLAGRAFALEQLTSAWQNSLVGQKQIIFVQAEAGFGKTTLINYWLTTLPSAPQLIIKTQCLDQYGQSEAYQPFLDGLLELLNSPQQELVLSLLKQHAPVWLLQLPSRYRSEVANQQEPFGATAGRLLREFAEFIEQLSKHLPLLWVIEDLHWSDAASIELVATLAYRQHSARFSLLSSIRPSHLASQLRLKALLGDLVVGQRAHTILLNALSASDLALYLQHNLPASLLNTATLELFQHYTEGQPLFVFTALEHIKKRWENTTSQDSSIHWLEQCISGGLKTLLEAKFASLSLHEINLLQAASIAISRSTSEGCAAILEQDILTLEDQYQQLLDKELWLITAGEYTWPDGSMGECYRFRHKLYQDFIYSTLSAARRRHYHLRLAKRLQLAYQTRSPEIAAKLAYHFEQGGDLIQAIHFLHQASQIASQRFAYVEAIQSLDRILVLQEAQQLDRLSQLATLEQRCNLLLASGNLAQAIPAYQQLITNSEKLSPKHTIRGLLGLAGALFWIDRQQCLVAGQQALELSQQFNDIELNIHVRGKMAHWCSIIQGYQVEYGQDYQQAMQLARQTNDPLLKCTHSLLYIYYLIISSNYSEALDIALETQDFAKTAGDANSYLGSIFFQAWAYFYQGQWLEMLELINSALALAEKNAQAHWIVHLSLQKSWLLTHQGEYLEAATLLEPVYQQTKLAPYKTSAYFFSLIIYIHLKTKQRDLTAVQAYLIEIQQYLRTNTTAIDWVLKLPLYQGMAEFYLKIYQPEQAYRAAQTLEQLAQQSAERTYTQLAQLLKARSLQAQGKLGEAQLALNPIRHALTQTPLALVQKSLENLGNLSIKE